ncbi:baseplate J/gp47 family protein [Roseateles sp. DXS20W]|uniref:Baseplate J/gp47 family protein n=1 Tax=Pelomonas lactea TaxID=3299030 RepID=A0ABW7GJX0_9BURK
MPFARPSLTDLIARAAADIEAALPGADARLRRSNLAVLGRMHAGAVHGLYGYLDWLAQQLMVDTAETVFLDRFAGIWGVQRVPAAFAAGPVSVTGTAGVVVPAGTQLQRSDGMGYTTTADAVLVAGAANVPVAALTAGVGGNADAGTRMAFTAPVSGVNTVAAVAAGGLTQGADHEDDAALRGRVLARIQQPPMGGARNDYEAWALEVAGVTRAWVYPLENGPGTVVVRFVRDGDASLIPDSAEVAAVQAYIDELRPVCAQVTVEAPTQAALNMTIQLTPNTTAVRAAVQAELADVLQREAMPGGTILLSHLREAISVAAGETNSVLVTPTADVEHDPGEMPVLGTITWS